MSGQSKWIKKGDKVLVLSGNDKGKVGEVLRKAGDRIVVQGVNLRKKHMKRREQNAPAEIVEMEIPIHISNVSLCTDDGKKIKLRSKTHQDGKKELYYLSDGKEVVTRTLRKARK